jgi:CSLREA domain-containing protein
MLEEQKAGRANTGRMSKTRLLFSLALVVGLLITLSFGWSHSSGAAQEDAAETHINRGAFVESRFVRIPQVNRASVTYSNSDTVKIGSIAPAAAIIVSNTNDTGAGSLRQAIIDANANPDVSDITFDVAVFNTSQTINLGTALPNITTSLNINGPGANLVTVRRNSLGSFRIFNIPGSGLTITISGLTITNGQTDVQDDIGGGIFSLSNLTLTNCAIVNNQSGNGGGVVLGLADGSFSGCTFSGNKSGAQGGGIFYEGDGGHTLRIINSTINGNRADSTGVGGGLWNGAANGNSTVEITSSTIANNISVTFNGGGINAASVGGTAITTIRNSIVANNSTPNIVSANGATITSLGYNLSSENSNTFLNQSTDQINVDPNLGPLANYGGPTQTLALLPGSPALDKGKSFALSTDQRGLTRPFNINSIAPASGGDDTDIGAFEFQGQILTVTKTADTNDGTCDADCSLREAIAAAASGDGIQFAPVFNTSQTITLSGTELVINKNLTISAPGANLLNISGNNTSRIFNINAGVTVNLYGVSVTSGKASSGDGGGILNAGTLNLSKDVVSGNSAQGAGTGGGIRSTGTLTVADSTISGNTANSGGGIAAVGTIALARSTISGNTSATGGGGLNLQDVSAAFTNSTISDNTTGGSGSLIQPDASANLTKNIISPDASAAAGAILLTSVTGTSTLQVTSCTIAANNAPINVGGGLVTVTQGGNATTTLRNTIVANNSFPNLQTAGGVTAAITSQGYNLTSDNSNTFLNQPTDRVNTDPLLTPLGNNGGPTQTHAFFAGSPALDAGQSSDLSTDQRGVGRPIDLGAPNALGGDGADIGAFEATSFPTATPTPTPTATPTPTPNLVQFSSPTYSVQEDCTFVNITVNRTGDTSGAATVDYTTSDGTASARRDYITAVGTLTFAAGETSKTIAVLINEDSYAEGNETFTVNLSNPSGVSLGTSVATVTIVDDPNEPSTNAIDDTPTFVCQQYHDFLNRQADAPGQAFWTGEITSCGTNVACIEAKRVNTSGAFYLSIEFQQTGYLVERMYKTSYGAAIGASTLGSAHTLSVPIIRLSEFLPDTQRIGQGVIVGQGDWQTALENNKQAFCLEFVQRSRFTTAFPTTLTPAQFVDALNANAGNVLSASERTTAINLFSGAGNTANTTARAQALRQIAEDPDLVNAEFNRAFVLMQYFGYLRRDPNATPDSDYTGYDFWLQKLNAFNGSFLDAEMVKAFLSSLEYRQRFGP